MNSYILPESLLESTAIHRTHFFCLTVTEFAFVFQTDESLQCTSHRIFPCISNKQIFSVTVTKLDFVFYNKTVKDVSKNVKNQLTLKKFFALVSSLYSYF